MLKRAKNWWMRETAKDPVWFIKWCALALATESSLVVLDLYLRQQGSSLIGQVLLFFER